MYDNDIVIVLCCYESVQITIRFGRFRVAIR